MVAAVDGDGDEAGGGELAEERDLALFVSAGAVEGDDGGTPDARGRGGGRGGGLDEDGGDALVDVGGERKSDLGEAVLVGRGPEFRGEGHAGAVDELEKRGAGGGGGGVGGGEVRGHEEGDGETGEQG